MAVHPDDASALLERLRSEGYEEAAIVGEVIAPQEEALIVR
jgi:hydrogenase maturation factor